MGCDTSQFFDDDDESESKNIITTGNAEGNLRRSKKKSDSSEEESSSLGKKIAKKKEGSLSKEGGNKENKDNKKNKKDQRKKRDIKKQKEFRMSENENINDKDDSISNSNSSSYAEKKKKNKLKYSKKKNNSDSNSNSNPDGDKEDNNTEGMATVETRKLNIKKKESEGVLIMEGLEELIPDDLTEDDIYQLVEDALNENIIEDEEKQTPGTIKKKQAKSIAKLLYKKLKKKKGEHDIDISEYPELKGLNLKIGAGKLTKEIIKKMMFNGQNVNDSQLDEAYANLTKKSNDMKALTIELITDENDKANKETLEEKNNNKEENKDDNKKNTESKKA